MFLPRMPWTPEQIRWDGLFPPVSTLTTRINLLICTPITGILVTGAGGSIGSALAHAIYAFHPRALVLLDNSEQNLYGIHSDLSLAGSRQAHPGSGIGCRRALSPRERFRPEIVYHQRRSNPRR
jgi:FlaA1/EpsC-like NDP-sugar epimerase